MGAKRTHSESTYNEHEHSLFNDEPIDLTDSGESEGSSDADDTDSNEDTFPELNPASDSESETSSLDSESEPSVFPTAKTIVSDITGALKREYPPIEPSYDSDSSTEEDPNRIGNVPLHWYDDLPHIGYTVDGKQVLRPAKGDALDKFLSTVEDPTSWSTAFDEKSQKEISLTPEELDLIRRLQKSEIPDPNFDPYAPTIEWFTGEGKEEVMPLTSAPEPKRRWVPSKWEKKKVMKIVRAIRQGRILPSKPKSSEAVSSYYNLWEGGETGTSNALSMTAPKRPLPTNHESYHPPPEYLPTDEERKQWEEADPEDRERNYLTQSFSALRHVPAYDQIIQEQFSRQLDLYLAPRIQRKKLNITADSLIPKLPSPSTLKPFPLYKGVRSRYQRRVRCIAISPDSEWVVIGDDSGLVSLCEVTVGTPIKQWNYPSKITAIEWCPRKDCNFFVLACEGRLEAIIPPNQAPSLQSASTEALSPAELPKAAEHPSPVRWESPSSADASLIIRLPPNSGEVKQITFHSRGDYFSTVSDVEGQVNLWMHQISKRHSQCPFRKSKGSVQRVLFHPVKSMCFVATQRYVRIYDLAAQKLVKTLQPGLKWISSMDIHSSGEHLIVGGYDRKLCWFDLELSEKPYKVLRYHKRAIRATRFHPSYPLFATCSDDGTIQIFHARVYNDLMTDPLIVPLKILKGHRETDGLGVLDIKWCPNKPWLVSAGADGDVAVWFS